MGAMTTARVRSGAAVLVALLCAVALTVLPTSALSMRVERLFADVALLAGDAVGWVMGGTGVPDPNFEGYLGKVQDLYLPASPHFFGQPTFDFATGNPEALVTPEQFCPIVCPGTPPLTFGSSVAEGAGLLNQAIRATGVDNPTGVVFGYSQSATVATVVMQHLQNNGISGEDLHFVLVGNPNNPIGGMLTRFQFPNGIQAFNPFASAPQHLPFLNVPLSIGPTPTDFAPTDIYTAAYDGWANFPEDPTNLPAVLNAIIGILTEHPKYPFYDPSDLAGVIHLNPGADLTNYYIIPTDELPLLWPIYQLGDFGKVLGHALQPGLELGINWGYGNPGNLATSQILDHAGDAVVGPWAVNASGELAQGSGLAGFIPMMDPLQMFAGAQDAGIHTFLDPLNDILGFAGLGQVPDWLSDAMHITYDLTNSLDQFLLSGWTDLVGLLQNALNDLGLNVTGLLEMIGPDAVFDGLPLISGAPVIAAVGLLFDIFNFFGA